MNSIQKARRRSSLALPLQSCTHHTNTSASHLPAAALHGSIGATGVSARQMPPRNTAVPKSSALLLVQAMMCSFLSSSFEWEQPTARVAVRPYSDRSKAPFERRRHARVPQSHVERYAPPSWDDFSTLAHPLGPRAWNQSLGGGVQAIMQSGRVGTEGDDLYYEVRGTGQPLLLIPGGGGDGAAYSLIADILCDEFKVITYDRRANARSTMNEPQNFEISQQSRDAVAVLQAVDETSVFVLGNSSGAVIALDMAKSHPRAVRAVVAHEPPLARVHQDAERWQRFFAGVYFTSFRFGPNAAMLRFALGLGIDVSFWQAAKAVRAMRSYREKSGERYLPRAVTTAFFVRQELLPVTNYLPDVKAITKNGVQVFMAAGKRSLDKRRFYAETARVLSERLRCEMVTFPGHHGSFVDMPDQWAATLRDVLHRVNSQLAG
jgi:pimeloyl-ACP methyl ester carboxylesterase